MDRPLAIRPDNAHFQLWADLNCPGLHVPDPIHEAIHDGKELDKKLREGILPLAGLRTVGPNG